MTQNFFSMAFEGVAGRDCEMRYQGNGKPIASFSVAVNSDYKNDAGELIKRMAWIRVTVFGKLAELCNQYVKKGGRVIVSDCRLNPDPATGGPKVWQANNGANKASYEVTAQTVRFLSSRDEAQAAPAGGFAGAPSTEDDSEYPF